MAGLPNSECERKTDMRDLCMTRGSSFVSIPSASTITRDAVKPTLRSSREHQIHEAVLLSFSDPVPPQVELLLHLSPQEWKKLLRWLDISGLPLYLLDRFAQIGLSDALPKSVVYDLQQKMKDNAQRTHGMVNESVAIQLDFQAAGLRYAVMKGISLSPSSVPRPELRHQFDLDYLMAEESAPEARRILERRGYRLYAITGTEWGFRINETPNMSAKDMYKDQPQRSAELHLDADASARSSRLDRVQYRTMYGMTMPMLSSVDIFLGQALHAFKDTSAGFSRTAHLLEFYRHALTQYDDEVFWHELRVRAGADRKTCLKIGVIIYLLTSIMGKFAPEALTSWSVDVLPSSARLWLDLYGRRMVFAKHPGTKLYFLLQKELETAGFREEGFAKKSLWPARLLPRAAIRTTTNDTISTRISRYRVQLCLIFSRLRFHIVGGIHYKMESYRWHRYLDRLSS